MSFPKLKHYAACLIVLFLPAALLLVFGFVFLALNENGLGMILLLVSMLAALAYLLLLFPFILGTEVLLDDIRYWKKDRLWFSLDSIADDPVTVKASILHRIEKHGELCTDFSVSTVVPLCVRYKRYSSISSLYSSREKNVYVYETQQLDRETYLRILESAKQITNQLKKKSRPGFLLTKEERKSPVCRAVAVIILTNFADQDIPSRIRTHREYGDTAILPCVVELGARRCVFDGMREVYMAGSTPIPSKNVAIGLITKLVFGGRLPLKGNDAFDLSHMNLQLPETTLWQHFHEFREAWKADTDKTAKIAARMKNDTVLEEEEIVYAKLADRTTSFLIDKEQSPYTLLCTGYWEHPKHQNISKADQKQLKELVTRHYGANGQAVVFEDEED